MSHAKKRRLPNLARIFPSVSDNVVWAVEPPSSDLELCRTVICSLLESGGNLNCFAEKISPCKLLKLSYRKILLRHCNHSRQLYFKILLPDFSWRWRRGPWFFTAPALREAVWFERFGELGIGVVDLVGAGILPWKKRFSVVQPLSVLITSSSLTTKSISEAAEMQELSLSQRLLIARTILDYVEKLHGNRIGHLDANAANILFDTATDRVLLCDLERSTWLRWWNHSQRVYRDDRKIKRTLAFLMSDDE